MALSLLLKSEPNWAKIFTKAVSVSTLDRGRLQRALHAWRVKNERRLFIFILVFFFLKQVNYDKFETKMAWYILYDKLKISFLPLLLIRS